MRRSTRWTAWTLVALAMTGACKDEAKPATSPSPTQDAPTKEAPTKEAPAKDASEGGAAPTWEKEGGTFAGPEAGGRGGSYRYTLCADGSYARWCLDAECERGSWRRDGGAVVLVSGSPDTKGVETRLALSADGQTLGDTTSEGGPFKLAGPPAPTTCGG